MPVPSRNPAWRAPLPRPNSRTCLTGKRALPGWPGWRQMRAGGFGPLGRSGLGETRTRVAELWRSGPACRCLGGETEERAGSGGDRLK